jgi:hypothetical protein
MKLNKGQIITTIIIAVVFVGLIAYDIYAFVDKSSGSDTLSWIILQFSWRVGAIPYFSGVLTGHFFIPIEALKGKFKPSIFISALVGGLVVSLLMNLLSWYYPLIPCVFGIIMGTIFWNQGKKRIEQ